jgi:hypothetical protein
MKGLPPELWGLGGANGLPPELFGGTSARPQRNWADVVMMIGAGLKDASSGGSENLMGVMKTQADRQTRAMKAAGVAQLNGLFAGPSANAPMKEGGASPAAGGFTGPNLRDAMPALLRAQQMGVDISPYVALIDKTQPEIDVVNGVAYDKRGTSPGSRIGVKTSNVGGWQIDENDPNNVGRFYGEAPVKGAAPVFDENRRHIGWRNMDGSIQAIQAAAAAEASAKADFNTVSGFDQDGRPIVTTAGEIARNGPLRGRSPEATEAAKIVAGAQATAATELPSAIQTAQQALTLIDTMGKHPGLPNRTGATALAPAIPGTPAADFEAMADQLKGKVFLEAYAGLKGGGQITEVEGQKAQQAIARLSENQSEAGYRAALRDLESVIRTGMDRAKQKAGAASPPARPAAGGAGQPSRAAIEAEMRKRKLLP